MDHFYYKITDAKALGALLPDLKKSESLILSGDNFFGTSPTKVEAGIICQRFTKHADIQPLESVDPAMGEDLAKLTPSAPESLITHRGWAVHDHPTKSEDYTPMDTSCGDQEEITPDSILTGVSRGDVASLVSAGGLGKSFLTLQNLVDMSCGRETFLTSKPKERKVVYLSLEDSMLNVTNRYKRVFKRMLEKESTKGSEGLSKEQLKWKLKCNLYVYSLPLVLIDNKGVEYPERVFELLQNIQNIDLIVIDTARRFQDLNENDSGQMSSYLRLLESIGKELNCATLLLHHSSKSGTLSKAQGVDVGASVARGSGAIVDNGRGTWVMCKLPKHDAEELNIKDEDRGKYVLLEHEKCNFEQAQPRRILERITGGLLEDMTPVISESDEGFVEDESTPVTPTKEKGIFCVVK